MHLKLPTLKYKRLRGDMIEVFKITQNIYDLEVSLELSYYIGLYLYSCVNTAPTHIYTKYYDY